jgi:hypothetical protein
MMITLVSQTTACLVLVYDCGLIAIAVYERLDYKHDKATKTPFTLRLPHGERSL